MTPLVNRVRVNVALYVVAMLAAALAVVLGVQVVQSVTDDPTPTVLPEAGAGAVVRTGPASDEEQARLAAVVASASAEATAFVNIRYDDAQASLDEVMAGATGDFKKQYATSTDGVIQLLTQNRSVMTGKVVWSGLVAADQDSATVVIATTGTVANKASKNKAVARNFRLQLQLVLEDDTWLTSDLQFVA